MDTVDGGAELGVSSAMKMCCQDKNGDGGVSRAEFHRALEPNRAEAASDSERRQSELARTYGCPLVISNVDYVLG